MNEASIRPGTIANGSLKRAEHMSEPRIFSTSFASVYPLYVQKAERKGRAKGEVDQVICWLTGHDQPGLERALRDNVTSERSLSRPPASIEMLP